MDTHHRFIYFIAWLFCTISRKSFASFTGTFLIGVGIAILNVILPSIIKDKFPNKFAFMTSVYTTSMGIVASLASGLSVPLAIQLGLGWKLTLLLWAIPTVVALIVWFYLVKFDRKTDEMDKPSQTNAEFKKMWRTPRAWQIALFLGLQSFLFYVTITWLPNILHHFGASRQLAGWLLSFTQLIGLPANFFVPILADRFYKRQEHVALIVSSFSIIGFFLLIISSQAWLFIMSIIFIGLGLSGTFSLALAFVGMRARDAKQAAQLSGMAQSLGYILAAVGPMLIGSLFDLTGAWLVPLIALIIVGLLTAYFGYCSGKDGYVL